MGKPLLGRVILMVSDMPASLDFYSLKLGLALCYGATIESARTQPWVVLDAGSSEIALHTGRSSDPANDPATLVFFVEDAEKEREALRSRGVFVSEVCEPHPGVKFVATRDPDGHIVQFQEPYRV